jgi:predicted ATPase
MLRQDGVRLLTLTGPGGTGKSRLAIRIAEEADAEIADGACFVELAPVATTDEVPRAIGRAVGVASPESAGVLAAAAERIADRDMLLVLDNFEHVLPAAPAIVDLLRACPRLSVLVTSRASLQLSAEHELQVPPLPVPAFGHATEAAIGQYAAVQLFVERSARVRPSFALTTENAETLAAICRRLDGLPLALELAAARMKLLTPRALLQRLDGAASGSAMRLLTRGSLDAPPRQRTLLDTMLWSYNLLTPAEQRMFRRLSIFSGGCTLEAAEAVVGDTSSVTLDLIGSLLDNSLLYVDEGPDADPRFVMLETLRELGLEKLRASGEFEEVAGLHARYYLAMVKAIGPQLFASAEKLRRAAPEHHNAQDALRWLFHHG